MKLLFVKDGLEIILGPNEKNRETTFSIANGEPEQLFTFPRTFFIANPALFAELAQAQPICHLETGFLFYSFYYQVSYCHFLSQTLPKLITYLNGPAKTGVPLLVPGYTELHRNLFELLEIQNVIILKDGVYEVDCLHQAPLYEAMPSPYTADHIAIYKLLRSRLGLNEAGTISPPVRKIYLKRDEQPSPEFNNSETGIFRKILNESDLIDELVLNHGFEVITLGKKTLQEKRDLLDSAAIVITPLGSNIMNFIFARAPQNIIFLSNSLCFGDDYIVNLLSDLGDIRPTYKTLHFPPVREPTMCDPLNGMNCPFLVDIGEVVSAL